MPNDGIEGFSRGASIPATYDEALQSSKSDLEYRISNGLGMYMSDIYPGGTYVFGRGSESRPSCAIGESDNGLYMIGSDNLGLSINGTKRWDFTTTSTTTTLNLLPSASDLDLGSTTQRWDLFGQDVNIDTSLTLSFITATHVLYAGTGGLVSGDAGLTYDAANDLLTITGTGSQHLRLVNGAASVYLSTSATTLTIGASGGTPEAPSYQISCVAGTNTVFNDQLYDIDFIVNGDTAEVFRVDASTDRLGVGVAAPDSKLHVSDSHATTTPILILNQASTGDSGIRLSLGTTISYMAGIDNSVAGDPFVLSTAASGTAVLGTGNLWSLTFDGHSTWSVSDTATTPFHDLIQSSTGDAALRFAIGTTASYAIGVDNSAADAFVLSYAASGSAVLGTSNYLTIATTGATTIAQWLNVGTATAAGAQGRVALGGAKDSSVTPTAGGLTVSDTTSMALGVGGVIVFRGNYTGTTETTAAAIQAYKTTATDAQFGFDLRFSTRTDGGTNDLRMAITATNLFNFYNSSAAVSTQISAVAGTATVFNEQGADIDTRIEGDTDANLLFLDASTDRVGVGTATPDVKFDVLSTSTQMRHTYTDGSVYSDWATGSNGKVTLTTAGTLGGFVFGGNYRFAHGTSALATSATEGFFHIQSCAGTPTGVPASIPTGQKPMVYDSTNKKLYIYDGGWLRAQVAGVDAVWA